MSDHTIVIIWVVKIFFVQFFCVFLPPLLNIFCFCYVLFCPLPFLSFIEPICAWNVPLGSLIFLKKSLVLPFYWFPLFLCIDHWKRLFLYLLSILWNSAFRLVYLSLSFLPFTSLLFSAVCKASSDSCFTSSAFLFLGDGFDHFLVYNVTNLRP